MKLREAREAKESVNNVCGELDIALPVFFEHAGQAVENALVLEQLLKVVGIAGKLQDERRAAYLQLGVVIVKHLGIIVQIIYVGRLVDVVYVGILELVGEWLLFAGRIRGGHHVLTPILQVIKQLLYFAYLGRMNKRAFVYNFFSQLRNICLWSQIFEFNSLKD